MKRQWKLWIGLLISAAALALALMGVDLRQLMEELVQAKYVYLIPATGAQLAYLLARSVRWRLLMGSAVSLSRSFWVTNIGYLVSNVLPLRLGDPARAVIIGRGGKVSTAAALSTVVVERVLDMLMVVLLLAVTLPFVERAGELRSVGPLAGVAALVALAVLIVLAQRPEWARAALRWVLARAPRLEPDRWTKVLDGFLEGLAALRSPRDTVALLAWSVVTWACVVLYYWTMLWVFVDRPALVEGSFLTCGVGLGMALPSPPGAIGVFEVAARYALELPFGVPEETALAIASVTHASQYVTMCLLGLAGLVRENLSFGRLRADIVTSALAEEGHDG